MRRLCDTAVTECRLFEGKEMFQRGQQATGMYFVRSGILSYHMPGYDQHNICEMQWVSEVAMWCSWFHRGVLHAKRFSELLCFNAEVFHDMVPRCPKSLRKF